jgi:predicted amidohydrolase YtcJ
VRGYTIDGARQLRLDDRVGSIEVGKMANLVVLSDDLFSVAREKIGEVTPSAVLFEGELVSGALELPRR